MPILAEGLSHDLRLAAMSLLHATWLPSISYTSDECARPALFIWADKWKVSDPLKIKNKPAINPFSLEIIEIRKLLEKKKLMPQKAIDISVYLSLPSKSIKESNKDKKKKYICDENEWTGLPLQAEEPIPKDTEWWPWQINGLAIEPNSANDWLSKLPLSGENNDLGDEFRWWSHVYRWALSLMARGSWLPQIELNKNNFYSYRARWSPLLNCEDDRQKLEEFSSDLPLVAVCASHLPNPSIYPNNHEKQRTSKAIPESNSLLCSHIITNRLYVMSLLEELIDAQIRRSFKPINQSLDPLLKSWEEALGSDQGVINLDKEGIERLTAASFHWKEGIAGNIAPAKAYLELLAPNPNENCWEIRFGLQAQAHSALKVPASAVWASGSQAIQLGDLTVNQPGEILLEGLGRALTIFPPIERGLENATPEIMQISPSEAFIFIKTATNKLRNAGVGVILPQSLSGGVASRLGVAIKADLSNKSNGFNLEQNLDWQWNFLIGGIKLTLKELENLSAKKSPLIQHQGIWIELRENDIKKAERFCIEKNQLNLNDALRLTSSNDELLMQLPVHDFEAGPKLQNILEKYHQKKTPDPLAAPSGFNGQLRPYQERGLGWLSFLYRFNQGACLADDMGLGKTIQLLAFIQYLKSKKELVKPILLIAPTSVITNWKREAESFTPELRVFEHYGSQRISKKIEFEQKLSSINIALTSYGILQRDLKLLKSIEWQGIILDEAQAIKNPNSLTSKAAREIASYSKTNTLKIALTGTPVENKVSEIWALMNFLSPNILGEENFFHQRYKLPIERYGDISSLKYLQGLVSPFILRRLKTDKTIITDLPEKIELNEWVGLSNEQKELYNKTVNHSLNLIASSEPGKRHGQVLGLLTKLKQICNHPAVFLKEENIDERFSKRSSKLKRLEEILEEIIDSGERALLFTQFTTWGRLLQSYLQQKWELEVPFLSGSNTKLQRQEMIDRFQEDPRGPQLFLLSLKAGGIGLNLTRANHVLHVDRWWNPAIENQATDRAYRIGQDKRVVVHKFIATASVEEKIHQMIQKKSKLAEDIIGSGEDWLGSLNITDLQKLVALEEDESIVE